MINKMSQPTRRNKTVRKVAKLTAVAVTVTTAALMLSGCYVLNYGTDAKLEPAVSKPAGTVSSYDEALYHSTNISSGILEWVEAVGWSNSYTLSEGADVWIPEVKDAGFSTSSTLEPCDMWIDFDAGVYSTSITVGNTIRLVDKEGVPATSEQVSDLIKYFSSDIKQAGWEDFEDETVNREKGKAGQDSWYAAPDSDITKYRMSKERRAISYKYSDEPKLDPSYLSYRITLADRGNGYVSAYVNSPCASVGYSDYNYLVGDNSSYELSAIANDPKNVSNRH